jgi:hypothetical protein
MKLLITALALMLLSFGTQEKTKVVNISFTIEEIQLVYEALGELPAKKVEVLRARIVQEANRQLADTTKKK